MKEYIKSLIEQYEEKMYVLEEEFDNFEDFNPCDASGGNFDDAYNMGTNHGAIYATISILYEVLEKLEEEE